MTDILKIALDRRAELHDEIARLDQFVRMAEGLLCRLRSRDEEVSDAVSDPADPADPDDPDESCEDAPQVGTHETTPGVTRMNLIRRGPAMTLG